MSPLMTTPYEQYKAFAQKHEGEKAGSLVRGVFWFLSAYSERYPHTDLGRWLRGNPPGPAATKK